MFPVTNDAFVKCVSKVTSCIKVNIIIFFIFISLKLLGKRRVSLLRFLKSERMSLISLNTGNALVKNLKQINYLRMHYKIIMSCFKRKKELFVEFSLYDFKKV